MAWFSKYSSNPFIRNVAVMFSGNGLALVVPFLFAPFISRIYTPEDFASFELFVKFVALVTVITSLRFELAIILPDSDHESKLLTRLCLRVLLFVTLASCLVIPFRMYIAKAFNNSGLADILWLFPFAVFIVGLYSIVMQVSMRLQKFNLLAANKILASTSNHTTKYFIGLFQPVPLGLVVGDILGNLVSAVNLLKSKAIKGWLESSVRQEGNLKSLFRRYKDFPLYNGSHAFYNEGYQTALLLIISTGFGEITLGLFAFAYRYLRVPLQVLGSSLAQVLAPNLSAKQNNNEPLRPLILKSTLAFFGIGIIPFSILFLFGDYIFDFVFGGDWRMAGEYASIMAPWLLANFVISPVSILPTIVERQRKFFFINLIFTLLILLVTIVFYLQDFDFHTILVSISVGNVLMNIYLFFWFLNIANKPRAIKR
jgi:O-antigen/teichoic acid export membrane protein